MVAGTCNVCIFCSSLQWSHNFRLKVILKSKVTKHKKQLKSSQMSVDAKTEDLASQEKISGSPANLTRTSMLSGTVMKFVPSEKAAETVIDQSSGCDLASSDGMYVTAKKYTNRDFEILFLRDIEGNFNEEHGFASSTQIYSGAYFPEFFTSTSEIPSAITEAVYEIGKHI